MPRVRNTGEQAMRPLPILPAALLTSMLAFSIVLGTPTQADAKKGNQKQVLAACKRTPSCKLTSLGGGDYVGSTSNGNFICTHGKCISVPDIKGKTPSKGTVIGGIRLPPGTVKPVSGGKGNLGNSKPIRHPVNVGVKNPPTSVKTDPTVGWKHGGMNQNGGHYR